MIKIDLITGFLGSGKTTFIKKYVQELLDKGKRIAVIENDFGAINIDMLLLRETFGDRIDLSMVVGGEDMDCHRRRLKTKLIEMGMLGYDRVIVEPSGIFDTDEFFDLLYEEPLDRWYEVGSVISILDAKIPEELSRASEYLLMSEAADAGLLIPSRVQEVVGRVNYAERVNRAMKAFGCRRVFTENQILAKDWNLFDAADWERVENCGRVQTDHVKLHVDEDGSYQNLFYFHVAMDGEKLRETVGKLFKTPAEYGNVIRVKGFVKADTAPTADGRDDSAASTADRGNVDETKGGTKGTPWYELNANREGIRIDPSPVGQEVIIVIGEKLESKAIGALFGETRSVTDYDA